MVANRPEFAEVVAATSGPAAAHPVNWHLTADEAAYIVDDCEATAFVADARFARWPPAPARPRARCGVRSAVGGAIDGFERYDEALAGEDGADIDDPHSAVDALHLGHHRPAQGRPPADTRPRRAWRTCSATCRATATCAPGPLYHAAPLAFSLAGPLTPGSASC